MLIALAVTAGVLAVDTGSVATPAAAAARVAPAAVVVHYQPAIPIVALRMSLQVDDPDGYAGAGHLFQRLMLRTLRDRVGRVGGHVQIERNSDALVYTVVGPAAELDYLAEVLRGVLVPPAVSPADMANALRTLAEARLAEWETAARHARAQLRATLFPADLPAAGTEAAAARFQAAALPALWGELYRPERLSVVAVGDVGLDEVRRAFDDLPAPPRERLRRTYDDETPVTRLAPAEATRGWLGLGLPAGASDPVAVTVLTRLIRDGLRARLPESEVAAEHWWTHHGQAVAVVVATPEAQLAASRRAIGNVLAATREALTEQRVRDAATATRRELLFHARTPERMAELVGSFADRAGDADALQRFFDGLDRVDAADVQRVLEELADATPARVDIPPQVLEHRR